MKLAYIAAIVLVLLVIPSAQAITVAEIKNILATGTTIYQNNYYTVKLIDTGTGEYYLSIQDSDSNMKQAIVPYFVFTSTPTYYPSRSSFIVEGNGNIVVDVFNNRNPISSGYIKFVFTNQYIKFTTNCQPYNGLKSMFVLPQRTGTMSVWNGAQYTRYTVQVPQAFTTTAPIGLAITGSSGTTMGVGIPQALSSGYFQVSGWAYGWFITGSYLRKTTQTTGWFVFDPTKASESYAVDLYNKVSGQIPTPSPTPTPTPTPIGYVNINQIAGYAAGGLALAAVAALLFRRGA